MRCTNWGIGDKKNVCIPIWRPLERGCHIGVYRIKMKRNTQWGLMQPTTYYSFFKAASPMNIHQAEQKWKFHFMECILSLTEAQLKNPQYWHKISKHSHLTMEFIEAHQDKPWNWGEISSNPNLTTVEFVEAHPEMPWSWRGLSRHPNLTREFIAAHPEKPWDWLEISGNHNLITMEFVEAHPEMPWQWSVIINHSFAGEKEAFIRKELQDAFRTSALKEELMQVVWHPRNLQRMHDNGHELFEE